MTQRLLAHSMILYATELAVAPLSWSLPAMVSLRQAEDHRRAYDIESPPRD
ncbi:hypothetical protein FB107DRAFT_272354 [Schizophyllum commune]